MGKWKETQKMLGEEPYTLIRAFGEGMTVSSVCRMLGISRQTYYNWFRKKEEFRNIARLGEERRPDRVEDALYKLAFGYEYEETVTEDRNGSPYVKVNTKHQPPNLRAIVYILQNRLPKLWSSSGEGPGEEDGKLESLVSAIREGIG